MTKLSDHVNLWFDTKVLNMFDTLTRRIGFACKYMHPDQTLPKPALEELQRPYNGRGTTVTSLRKLDQTQVYDKLRELVEYNIDCYSNLIEYVSSLPLERRMLRLGSDLCPMYTHDEFSKFYQIPDMKDMIGNKLAKVGEQARESDVRLSMHPGQFVTIVSENESTVERALKELEYHADIAELMGYGLEFQDFKINIHLSGKGGVLAFENAYEKMSGRLRNMLTLENDEYVCGINELMSLSHRVPIVLDIHHHLIKYDEYIRADDIRLQYIKDSWRGVRPVIHYSYSDETLFPKDFVHDRLYSIKELENMGLKRGKLRSHSTYYPNFAANEWALSHLEWADIMCEAKAKNLASEQLYSQWKNYDL